MNTFTQLENNELAQIAKYSGAYTKFMSIAFYEFLEMAKKKTDDLTKISGLSVEFSPHPTSLETTVKFLYLTHKLTITKDYNLDSFILTQQDFDDNWDVYTNNNVRIINTIEREFNKVPKTIVLYTLVHPRITMSPTTFSEVMSFGSLFGFKDADGNFINCEK